MSRTPLEGSVYISDIAVSVQKQSGKTLNHIAFRTETKSLEKGISVNIAPGDTHEEVFDPVLELSTSDRLLISISPPRAKPTLVTVELSRAKTEARDSDRGRRTYTKHHDGIEFVIGIPYHPASGSTLRDVSLPSTVGISDVCPRPRLLVIGNCGVGKSTLIKEVFGVQEVDVSDNSRSRANIDQEFIARNNGPFILHDTPGLEAGEHVNANEIKRFISERRNKEDVEDRLHAVWVCLAVPYAKARFLEAWLREFLQDRKNILGDIPIIIVITQLDLLDKLHFLALRSKGIVNTLEDAKPLLEKQRSEFLEKYCIDPLRAAKVNLPHVAVSAERGFGLDFTTSQLIKKTTSEIERYMRADPSYGVMAERRNTVA